MAASPKTTPITHIVLFRYSPSVPWSTLEAHFTSFLSLPTRCLHPVTHKPYILSLRAGRNISKEGLEKGMTHGFVLEFASQEDLDYYLEHDAVHAEFSKHAHPMIEDQVVVDVRDGEVFGDPNAEAKKARFAGRDAEEAAREEERKKRGNIYTGSCHCGELGWTVRLEKAEHVLCHCDTCKKLGGGSYSCNQIVPVGDLRITKGAPRVYTYTGASGKAVRCFFCGTCTSHVYHHQEAMSDKVIVRTLLLDGGKEMPATGEIFAEGKLSWVNDLKEALVNGHR